MRHLLFGLIGLIHLTSSVTAQDTTQRIDLTQPSEGYVIEEEYQSIRPGAMDEKFRRDQRPGDTQFHLSHQTEETDTDEYGVNREIVGPATTDYSRPPELPSND